MDISALIKALELELLQPEVRKSKERLNELIAENFVEIGASGRKFSKQNVIKELLNETEINFTILSFNTIEISPDTILSTYEVEKEIVGANHKILSSRTSIWKNINGRWQIVFHQGSDH
jgi:hypothetical protein